MEISNQPKLIFEGVNIVHIDFNNYQQYDNKSQIDLIVDPKVFYPSNQENHFSIVMESSLNCDGFFKLVVVATGNFVISSEGVDTELRKNFINANAPAIMFPYIRAFISTLTSNLGNVIGNITIPTQFFNGDLPEIDVNE
jgi:preprotein translocase subunit SecB